MSHAVPVPAAAPTSRLPRWLQVDLTALLALFQLALQQQCRARRLLVLAVLFLLPAALAIVIRYAQLPPSTAEMEVAIIFMVLPHTLVPLTALLFASGMIQDEQEEQTLTYLLIRPLPRWTIYATKLLAAVLVAMALTCVFTLVTFGVVYWGATTSGRALWLDRAVPTAALLSLSLAGYCALFGLLALYVRRSLVVGLAYILVFEGLLANIDFVVRKGTLMYYFRVLVERWLKIAPAPWAIDLDVAPSAWHCATTILAVAAAAAVLGAAAFAAREFRVKTPEGN